MTTATEFLTEIAGAMCQTHHWRKTAAGPVHIRAPLSAEQLVTHAEGGQPVGLCPITPGSDTTRVALLDFDSHKGEVKWDDMAREAAAVAASLRSAGLKPMAFRSSGGNGIHLMVHWMDPQDAHSARAIMREALDANQITDGAGGLVKRQVEVFPKQDSVPADGWGSMFVLPFAKESLALDDSMKPGTHVPHVQASKSVPVLDKPKVERKTSDMSTPEFERLRSAVHALKARDYEYGFWRDIVFAIYDATAGGEEGLALAQEFDTMICAHERGIEWLNESVWPYIAEDRGTKITAGTLFHYAGLDGWQDPQHGEINTDGMVALEPEDEAAPAPEHEGFAWCDLASIDGSPPPEREWIIKDWLARGALHALFSRGGKGKSLIMQQLLTSIANGTAWLGEEVVAPGPVMGFFCEEDDRELRWRQERIFRAGQLSSAEGAEQMYLEARLGRQSNLLVTFDEKRRGFTTAFFREAEKQIEALRPCVVVVDNIAQVYAGIENDRSTVTQFANALASWARKYNVAVILVGHVAKDQGSEFSGSTAWENVARVRWFFSPSEQDKDLMILKIAKTNIGSTRELKVQWRDGVFHPVQHQVSPETWAMAESDIVRSINMLLDQNTTSSHEPRKLNYLPKLMLARGLSTVQKDTLASVLGVMIGRGDVLADQQWRDEKHRNRKEGMRINPDYVGDMV